MKSSCSIFRKELFQDIGDVSSFDVSVDWLKQLIPTYDASISGIWRPIVIYSSQSKIQFTNILFREENLNTFNPCNCIGLSTTELINSTQQEVTPFDCSYCNDSDYSISWNLVDNNPNQSESTVAAQKMLPAIDTSCCQGACDVRMFKDDYLTKLPALNNSYLNTFYDWKYMQQFPACSNLGLGHEQFCFSKNLVSFENADDKLKLMIDWTIKERISEIPPNGIDTHHKTIDDHQQAYFRSLGNSKTCGNFLLTSLHPSHTNNPTYPIFSNLIDSVDNDTDYRDIMPDIKDFTNPYGFKNTDHYNIFVNKQKLGSYWKWNYSSGILCWYRYYDIDRPEDEETRLIPGVDLYISDGDVFYATNDGPEPLPVERNQSPPNIKACPSGLKLIKNSSVTGIIPSGSNFIYISTNIYNKTHNIMEKLYQLEEDLGTPEDQKLSPIEKLQLSATLATGPNYHEVTVDLLKAMDAGARLTNPDYSRDVNKHIELFNKAMLHKEQNALNRLNIVKTKTDLVNTLVNKYGCYLWCPPKTTTSIQLKKSIKSHCYIDLDFEPTVKLSDTRFTKQCTEREDCYDSTILRKFNYNQNVSVGNLNFNTNTEKKYINKNCSNGVYTVTSVANAVNAYFNGSLIKQSTYGNGCSSFYDKYLRPASYDLALKKYDEELCAVYKFCNKKLAFKYNNDKNWFGTPDEVKEGMFDDNSVILHRRYPATAVNVNANRIGFHKDGGLYYDTNSFGKNNVVFLERAQGEDGKCNITFETKDIGIKVYSISIFKLRSKAEPQCKTFPLEEPCKCFPLVSVTGHKYSCDKNTKFGNTSAVPFTPNLSTQSSPDIKSYGGYTAEELEKIVDGRRLPNHPAPGTNLTHVNKIIDPLNPYECLKTNTATMSNYVKTKWQLSLQRYNTNHSDIWVKLLDSAGFFSPLVPSKDEKGKMVVFTNSPNRRYTTKGVINGVTVFHNQNKVLFNKNDGSTSLIDVELINPFLHTLLENEAGYDFSKYPYSFLPCSYEIQGIGNQSNRSSHVFDVPIVFTQVPRKQILNFNIEPIKTMGKIKQSLFHPNSGLMPGKGTSLIYRPENCSIDFDYENAVFSSNPTNTLANGIIFSGIVSDSVKKTLSWTNELEKHKKLRLYIKYNNSWYEYLNPHVFGYFNEDSDSRYPGYPMFFEYTEKDQTQIFDSALIPASAKYNTQFFYIQNITPTGYEIGSPVGTYPLSALTYSLFTDNHNSKNKIIIPGSRAYFMLPEKDSAIQTPNLSELSQQQQDDISIDSTVYETNSGNRFRYVGTGDKTNKESYELLPPRDPRDNNFSDLLIDLDNRDDEGYIYNTERLVDNANNNYLLTLVNDMNDIKNKYVVLKKSLYVENGINTVLELQLCENCTITPERGTAQINTRSLVVLQNFPEALLMERSRLISNSLYKTKWGDVINLDPRLTNDLNNSPFLNNQIGRLYPSQSPYKNLLHKISLNNLQKSTFFYHVVNTGSSPVISSGIHSYKLDIPYYHIHQKYNIGLNTEYDGEDYYSDYQNFIPIIDINLTKEKNPQDFLNNNIVETGYVYLSGIRSFTPSSGLLLQPSSAPIFFVSLENKALLRPILFDKGFYNDTLRVDYPYFRLSSLNKISEKDSAGCSRIIEPDIRFGNTNFSNYFDLSKFSTSTIKTTFNALPIYCDSDIPNNKECLNLVCEVKTIGYVNLQAFYAHHPYRYISAEVLPDEVEYAISVDEGLYSSIVPGALPSIQRFEVPPNSVIFNDDPDSCYPNRDYRPPISPTYIDSEYQSKLEEYVLPDDQKGELVKNTDILANEMLFRLLYGSKQEISYDTIKKQSVTDLINNKTKKSISSLVQYSNPRTTADKIYDLIPYDYSLRADTSRRKISGIITIEGVLSEGTTTTVSIGSNVISINIADIEGKVCVVASCNGKSYKSVIKDKRNIRLDTAVVIKGTKVHKTQADQQIEFLRTCKNGKIPVMFWQKGHYYSGMKFDAISWDGTTKEVSVDADYLACKNFVQFGTKFDPPGSNATVGAQPLYEFDPNDGRIIRKLRDALYSMAVVSMVECGFAYGGYCPPLCGVCNSRGGLDGPIQLAPQCQILTSNSAGISIGRYARGLYANGSCLSRNGKCNALSPYTRSGDFDALIGGTTITQYGLQPNCKRKNNDCSPSDCMGLDSTDKWGKIYTPFRYGRDGGFPAPICECREFTYDYCTVSDKTCPGDCRKYDDGFPKMFSYNFEYCGSSNYKFNNMKGHLYRYKAGQPVVSDGVSESFPCTVPNTLTPAKYVPGRGSPEDWTGYCSPDCACDGGTADETCFWTECILDTPPDYDIYLIKTPNPSPYKPTCPEQLCYISYDNNKITIDLPGTGENHGCFDVSLRNVCPEISIDLPNDTFTFSDSITSECSMCDVDKNEIKMNPTPQNPKWDIITETRTAILGYLAIEGDRNIDIISAGLVWAPIISTAPQSCGMENPDDCCNDGCYGFTQAGVQCGKSNDASRPWAYGLTCNLNGSPGPTFNSCIGDGNGATAVGNIIGFPGFEVGSDNGTVKQRHIAYWESLMASIYADTAACHNNVNAFDINDLVEGIVPDSCSPLSYTVLNYPMVAVRQTTGGGEISGGSFGVRIAYFTYQYRRPRTIQDIFLKDNAVRCSNVLSHPASSYYNITEKYETKDCESSPSCFDTSIDACDKDKICCQERIKNVNRDMDISSRI